MKKRLIIIGGGPGGYTAAIRASQLGADVTLIEKGPIGGTCLNVGCIPTKSLLDSSHTWAKAEALFSQNTSNKVPWDTIMSRKNLAVKQLRAGVERLLRTGKITVIQGTATLGKDKQIVVQGKVEQTFTADRIIIASGSRPILPPIPGIHTPGVMTSDDLLSLTTLPTKLAIIGGGVIGVEFATIFAELGVEVVVIEAAQRILPNMDPAISIGLQEHLEKQNASFCLDKKVEQLSKNFHNRLELSLSRGDVIIADLVLVAVGREAVLEPLKLEEAGIAVERKKIKVNAYQQTTQPGIYAVGDCSSPMMLAHVAMVEARVAVEHALDRVIDPVVYDFVPQCVYTHPEVAVVGLTMEEARTRGFEVHEGIFPLSASGRALVEGESTGFIKVVAEKKYGRILGVHILAPNATEMIGEATLALNLESTVDEIQKTVHPHPTIIEGMQEATLALNGIAIHLPHRN